MHISDPICYLLSESHGQLSIFKSIFIQFWMYVSLAYWWQYTNAWDRDRIEWVMEPMRRSGFLPLNSLGAKS